MPVQMPHRINQRPRDVPGRGEHGGPGIGVVRQYSTEQLSNVFGLVAKADLTESEWIRAN